MGNTLAKDYTVYSTTWENKENNLKKRRGEGERIKERAGKRSRKSKEMGIE